MTGANNKSIGDRGEWIMHLLYAPNEMGESRPIVGRTRIMKACFLLDRKLEEHFDKQTDFEFIAHKYGPFDQGVYIALEKLEDANQIQVTPEVEVNHERGMEYELTHKGAEKASESYYFLSPREQDLVEWVKYKQAERPLGTLLSYVYSNYPRYTTESELV